MTDKKQVLDAADAEIAAFEEWFRGQGAEPLARFESAILKTFLVAKATGKFRTPSDPGDPETSISAGSSRTLYSTGS